MYFRAQASAAIYWTCTVAGLMKVLRNHALKGVLAHLMQVKLRHVVHPWAGTVR